MKYLLMIYGAEQLEPQPPSPEFEAMMEGYEKFTQQVMDDGVYQGGEPLEPVASATTVRLRQGKLQVTDGPFAETKEALGGYYLLDCENLDKAIEYASKIPSATYGCIEIRPIMQFEG